MPLPSPHRRASPRRRTIPILIACAFLLSVAPPSAPAAERPGVNLGGTSFFDGFGGLNPGWAVIHYVGNASYDVFNGPDGHALFDWSLNTTYYVPQMVYTSPDIKLLGGSLGIDILLPFSGQSAHPLPTNGWGPSDPIIGPYIEFAPIMSDGKPIFAHGVELDVFIPLGRYDHAKAINPGTNYWSLSPFYKATWIFAPKWELSGRLCYIHNFEHSEDGETHRTGNGFWLNFAGSYEVFESFRLGFNGYWLRQLEEDVVGLQDMAFGAQESLYLGPGLSYTFDKNNIVNLNAYLPIINRNSFSGGAFINLQYIQTF